MRNPKNDSFFTSKVLPILQSIVGILALAYQVLEVVVKYFMILVIAIFIGLIFFFIFMKEFGLALISTVAVMGWYFFYWLFYRKDKKKRK
ncbi:hypothetical protein [Ectobacillus panaciterrae]|uniref:hypothetical protein n=1 Tax=Ectobacillus panaciterrae TaxID=363872 RepID=UPI0004081BC0|nr:hypothetical protein [Ectobacillus panaciterrae]